jgi:hypothetical protein
MGEIRESYDFENGSVQPLKQLKAEIAKQTKQ